jgi:hypothetical protein
MNTPTDSPADSPAAPAAEPSPRAAARPTLVSGVLDALIVAVWFAVSGLVGALVWWQVTTLPKVAKEGDAATLAPGELVKQVGIDGWFFLVALVGGLLGGAVLMAWRRRDPLLMVVLVALGGGLASWLTIHVGLALGPGNVLTALRDVPDGGQVSTQLKLHAPGMAWIWPIAAVLGALVYVWVLRKPDEAES